MKLVSPSGKTLVVQNPERFRVDWDKKSRSIFQFKVKQFLKRYWKNHIVFEEFPVPRTRLSLDFFNISMNVAIEVQGAQHKSYNKFFHGNTRLKYLSQLKRDQNKFDFCQDFDIVLVEIYSLDELTKEFFESQGVIL